ncbi:unnamed protein product [Prorocentrum cordatum]|uniref:Uncharacterized protein n=1 Tax=Prorocentrum cordatum TaxID=2364126 RepID=A0ABN9UTV6_9DINO|nr:unnamed protein product [Polarella glacialis]
MARLWLVASLVGARGVVGLGAAPADPSMMQFATAVDESTSQQAAAQAGASSGFAPFISGTACAWESMSGMTFTCTRATGLTFRVGVLQTEGLNTTTAGV